MPLRTDDIGASTVEQARGFSDRDDHSTSSHLHSALLLAAGDALPRLQATPCYLLSSIIATELKQLPACNNRLKGERIVEAEGP